MLLDDAVMVVPSTTDAIGLAGNAKTFTWDATLLSLLQKLGPESPMKVQLNDGTAGRDFDDGLWLPVPLQPKWIPSGGDNPQPGSQMCSQNQSNNAMLPGWNTVTVPIGGLGAAVANPTGIRYT